MNLPASSTNFSGMNSHSGVRQLNCSVTSAASLGSDRSRVATAHPTNNRSPAASRKVCAPGSGVTEQREQSGTIRRRVWGFIWVEVVAAGLVRTYACLWLVREAGLAVLSG